MLHQIKDSSNSERVVDVCDSAVKKKKVYSIIHKVRIN